MSWPLRGTSRDTHTHDRTVAQPVAGAQFGPRDLVGREPVDVHAGRQVFQRRVAARTPRRTAPRVYWLM